MPFDWDRLLELIDDGKVVPIIGQDLLRIHIGGKEVLLVDHIANALAAKLGVAPPAARTRNPLGDVAHRYRKLKGSDEWLTIYSRLKSLLPDLGQLPLPESLVKLAKIKPLRLFVTTTFDPLLQRALDDLRHGGEKVTSVLSFSPTKTQDVEDPIPEDGPTTVFHLFGRISAAPDYAVTEDDFVEFMHALQSSDKRPPNLFRELSQRDLLIVGNSLNNWLARFFLRSTKRERLWLACQYSGFVVDDRIRADEELLLYLEQSPYVKVFEEGAPIEFVNKLYERWCARQSELERESGAAGAAQESIVPGCAFISYAKEDRDIAQRIAKRLLDAKIAVWFDRSDLRSGDNFGVHIRSAIKKSGAFIPVISAKALHSDDGRYFRLEWQHAIAKWMTLKQTARYIHPVVVDDTPYDDPEIPERFTEVSWERLTADGPSSEWVETIRGTVRSFRSGKPA